CGGGSGCCQRAAAVPVATCGSGCQQGYQCGAYGCTRRKALSALTARINPNFIFRTCCEARGLPDACLRYCHFNTYTASSVCCRFTSLDATYLPCYDIFENMKRCFFVEIRCVIVTIDHYHGIL
ncbi:hypothetical protein GCK32_014933, partial [Trichostrongylus colubriformis]